MNFYSMVPGDIITNRHCYHLGCIETLVSKVCKSYWHKWGLMKEVFGLKAEEVTIKVDLNHKKSEESAENVERILQ